MTRRLLKHLLLTPVVLYAGLRLLAALVDPAPLPAHPFFAGGARPVLVIAHRGGPQLGPESTIPLYRKVAALGVDVLEMDVRTTADGVLVVAHDEDVARTTGSTGRVDALTLGQLRQLDAGYTWSPDGRTYPWRGQGLRIPTVEEMFTSFPGLRFVVEVKTHTPAAARALCGAVQRHGVQDRVAVASFHSDVLDAFRQACPGVVTAGSTAEVALFLVLHLLRLDDLHTPPFQAFMVPLRFGPLDVVDARFVDTARRRNLAVQVWTIDDRSEMARLVDLGVDGIMTDRPTDLISLLDGASPP